MDYKTVSALLGQRGAGLTDYDQMVEDRRAKTQAELAGLDEMESLIGYTTPPQLMEAKTADIQGRRDAIAADRQALESDEDFLRRYAASHEQGVYSPTPTEDRGMEPYIPPSAADMRNQPQLSSQQFSPGNPVLPTDEFTPDYQTFEDPLAAGLGEFARAIPRGAANMAASAPAIFGTMQASSNRDAAAYLDESENVLRQLAEKKRAGMDEIEFIQEASRMIDNAPQAIRQKVSQAIGAINAGDDPETVITKYRDTIMALPTETKDTGGYQLAQDAHEAINSTLPVRPEYKDSTTVKIGEGAGSLAPMVAAALIPGVGPLAAIGTGMVTQGGAATEEAVRDKADEDDILNYGLAGTAIGSLEALPVGKLLGTGSGIIGKTLSGLEKVAPETMSKVGQLASKLSPAGRSALGKVATQVAGQAVEEGAQEGVSQTLLNAAGKLTYDENRDLFEGVPEAVAIGAIVGGGFKGVQIAGRSALDYKDPATTTASGSARGEADNPASAASPSPAGGGGLGGLEGEIMREPAVAEPISGTLGVDPNIIDGRANQLDPAAAPAEEQGMSLGGLEGEILRGEAAPGTTFAGTLGADPTIIEGEVNRAQIGGKRMLPGSTEDYEVIDEGDDLPEPALETEDELADLSDYARKTLPSRPLRIEKKEDMEEAAKDTAAPTEAQKQAGNYRKGHMKVDGFDVTIETPKGTERKGVDKEGKEWSVEMPGHYGYIKRTEGMDGDNVDVTVGEDIGSDKIYVVDQVDAETKAPDEHKVIMGTTSPEAARALYEAQFSDGKGADRVGAMVEMDGATFKAWLKNGNTKMPIAQQMPDKAVAKPTLEELFAQQKEKTAARRATSSALAKEGKPVRLTGKDGRTAMAGPDMSEPGKFRLTRFDDKGPSGHTVYNSLEEAIDEGMREGYAPAAKAAPAQAKAFKDEQSTAKASSAAYTPPSKEGDGVVYDGEDMQISKSGEEFVAKVDGKAVARMSLSWRGPYATSVEVDGQHRRKGLATKLYDTVEKFLGRRMIPSPLGISDEANALWKRRLSDMSPEERQSILQEAVDIGRDAGVGKSTLERMQKLGYQIPDKDAKKAPLSSKETGNAKVETGAEGLQSGNGQPGSNSAVANPGDPQPGAAPGRVPDGKEGAGAGKPAGAPKRGVTSKHAQAADARGRNRGRIPEAVRGFAEKEGDSEKLTLTHFGRKFHSTIKPQDGWATRGQERDRASHPDFLQRTYYGIGVGQPGGYQKEVAGKFGHKTSIDPADLYDIATDPDNLSEGKTFTSYEKAIHDAGYAGYITQVGTKGNNGPAAVVFYDAEVEEHFDDGIDDPKDMPRAKGLEKTVRLGETKKRLFVGPVKIARDAKAAYAKRSRIRPATTIREYVKVDEDRARRIAQAFEEMKHDPSDPLVKSSYDAMIRETLDQYRSMLDAGFKAEMIKNGMKDPYEDSPRLAIEDIRDNNHMWIFPTDDGFGSSDLDVSDNPLLAKTEFKDINGRVMLANDVFRAVHDYFGHAVEGNGMRARGEEMAWRVHASMYSKLARRAMTTETRGQNSWVNYGPHGDANKTASGSDTTYAPQKIGLLPEWVSEEGLHDPTHLKNIARMKNAANGRGPMPVKQTRVKKPDSLIEFIAKNGGIKEQTGELKSIGLTDRKAGFVSGAGPVVRSTGNPPDRVREMAEQAGYLREGSTLADLYDALDDDARSDRTFFSQRDDAQAERWRDAEKGITEIPFFDEVYNLAPGFYSALTRGVEKAKQVKAQGKDWKAIIAALPGVRKAEIEWIDVNGWLDSQEGQVTKEDLVNYIKANEIEIRETILTPNGIAGAWDDDRFSLEIDNAETMDPDEEYLDQLAEFHMDQAESEARDRLDDEEEEIDEDWVKDRARELAHQEYMQNPEQQGEITITYGDGSREGFVYSVDSDGSFYWEGENYGDYDELRNAVVEHASGVADERGVETAFMDYGTQYNSYVEQGGRNYREILLSMPGLENEGTNVGSMRRAYDSSHFEKTPNIIVHARTTDRQGGNVLFIEEVQSDLGSDIRKEIERNGTEPTQADIDRYDQMLADQDKLRDEALDGAIEFADMIEARLKEDPEKIDPLEDSRSIKRFLKAVPQYYGLMETISDTPDGQHVQTPYGYEGPHFFEDTKALVKWVRENFPEQRKEYMEISEKLRDGQLRITETPDPRKWEPHSLPAFPFEGESYYHLAMKRLLRMAVDEGKNAIAWTPGYMQGRRWSQAVQNVVSKVSWGETYDTGREVELRGANGIDVIKVDQNGIMQEAKGGKISTDDIKGKPLSELVGKQIADQVMATHEGNVSGQQILIGGDGYKIAYDRNMKGFMEKFAKRYGSSVTVDKKLMGQISPEAMRKAVHNDPSVKPKDLRAAFLASGKFDEKGFDAAFEEMMTRMEGIAADQVAKAQEQIDKYKEALESATNSDSPSLSYFQGHVESAQKDLDDWLDKERQIKERKGDYYDRNAKVAMSQSASVFTTDDYMRLMWPLVEGTADPVWRVEITEAMRDAILEGQPFSIGRDDYRITPEAQNKIDDLLATIRKVAPGLKVKMDMSINNDRNIWGKYSRDNGAITIAAVALQAGRGKQVFGHEALHAFVDHGLLTKQEIAILQRYAEKHDLIGKYGLREQYEQAYGARGLDPEDYHRMINEEGIAELVGELIANPKAEIPGDLAGLIGKLKRLLERIANAVRGLGFQTTSDILQKISSGEVGGRSVEGFTPKDGVLYSLGQDHLTSIKRTTADDLGDFLASDNKALRKGRALQRYLQDKFLSVKLMQRALADQISDNENAYLAEELSAARIPERTQEMNDKMQDVLEDLHEAKVPRELFERFLRMKHAEERNEQIAKINTKFKDGGSGIRTAVAERWLRQARRVIPADQWQMMEDAARKVYALNKASLKIRLDGGLIDRAYYTELTSQYRYYVPLKGHEFADDLKPISSNRGYGAKGKGIMQAMGRRSEAQNTLSYVVEDYRRAIYSAERNKVNIALFDFIKNNSKLKADGTELKNDFIELDPVRYKRILVKRRGLYQGRKVWVPADFIGDDAKIASYLAGLEGNASERMRIDPTPAHNDLPVMIDGKRHILRVKNDTLLNDLLDMHTNVERIPFFSAAMGGFTRLLTMWNPAFGPTNFVRDVMGVGLTTGSELGAKDAGRVMRDAFKMTRIILKAVRNQSSSDPDTQRLLDLYKKMKLSGGSTGFSHVIRDAESIQRELEHQAEWMAGNRSTTQVLKHGIVTLDRFMEKFNRVFEDATRLAAYKNRLDAGDTDKQALSYAKNVTVNFNKRGHQAGFSQWYAFANANFQGNYRMLRALINGKNGGKVLSGIFGAGFFYGLANILMGYDDENPDKINSWYEKNQYDKAFYIILGPIKLPKPHGFMIPFDIGTKAAELMMAAIDPEHNNPERRSITDLTASALAEVGANLTSFVPIGTQEDTILRFFPTLTAPLASAALNMSPFGGSLYPEGFDKTKPKWKQFYAETPEIYHKAAQFLNTVSGGNEFQSGYLDTSPEVIEFLINSYLGGAGGELRKASALAMTGVDAALGNETKPIRIEDIPIIRRFFPSQRTNSLTDYYYQFSDRMQEVKNAMSEAKDGSEAARAFLKEHEVERRLIPQWEAIKKQRTAVRKKITALDEERLEGGSVGLRRDALINKRSLIERRFARTYQIEDQIADLQKEEQTPAIRQAVAKLQRDRQVMQENIAKLMADQDQMIANRPSDPNRMSSLSGMFK